MTTPAVVHANTHIRSAASQIYAIIECVVIGIHYPGDESSISKRDIEYDLMPVVAKDIGRLRNVPFFNGGVRGFLDEAEYTLIPKSKLVTTYGGPEDDVLDTDGDRVLVQFVNGSISSPVITHVLTHEHKGRKSKLELRHRAGGGETITKGQNTRTARYPDDSKSYQFGGGTAGNSEVDLINNPQVRRVHYRVNGTHLTVDNAGDIFINFKHHPTYAGLVDYSDSGLYPASTKHSAEFGGTPQSGKRLVIQNENKDLIRIEVDLLGKLTVAVGEALVDGILAQIGDGAVSVAIADNLQSLWGSLQTNYAAHTHPTGTGPSGTPSNAVPNWDATINSSVLKIPDETP